MSWQFLKMFKVFDYIASDVVSNMFSCSTRHLPHLRNPPPWHLILAQRLQDLVWELELGLHGLGGGEVVVLVAVEGRDGDIQALLSFRKVQ